MTLRLYLDADSLAEAGNSEVFDDFNWLIHQQTYDNLAASFIEYLESMLVGSTLSPESKIDLALSIYPITNECFSFAASYINVLAGEQLDADLVYSDRSLFYPIIVSHRANKSNSTSASLSQLSASIAKTQSFRSHGRNFAKGIRTRSRKLSLLKNSRLRNPRKYSMTSNALSRSWVSSDDLILRSLMSAPRRGYETFAKTPPESSIDHQIAEQFCEIVESLGYESDGLFYEFVRRISSIHFNNAKVGREKNYEKYINTNGSLLLTATGGGFESRLMSHVFQRNNLPVVRFSHGGERGLIDDVRWHYAEVTFTDSYILHGKTEAEQSREAISRKTTSLTSPNLRLFGAGSESHNLIRRKQAKPDRTGTVKNVMVTANSLGAERRSGFASTGEEAPYLEWHRRLLIKLSKTDYNVISKRHPKDLFATRRLFSGIVDKELISGSFTNMLDQADAFVFDFAASAFMEALCTNKPVVLIEFPHRTLSKAGRDDVAKVCTIVPAEFDDQNRIVTDIDHVINGLREPVDHTARDHFVNRYLLEPSDDIGDFIDMLR